MPKIAANRLKDNGRPYRTYKEKKKLGAKMKRRQKELRPEIFNKPKPPAERSRTYNKNVGMLVVQEMAKGRSLIKICSDEELSERGVPHIQTVLRWRRDIPEFAVMLDQAYIDRADHYMEDLIEIFDQVRDKTLTVHEARFLADQYKWILCKLHPKYLEKGGDTINIGGQDSKVQFNITLAGEKPKEIPNAEFKSLEGKDAEIETDEEDQEE